MSDVLAEAKQYFRDISLRLSHLRTHEADRDQWTHDKAKALMDYSKALATSVGLFALSIATAEAHHGQFNARPMIFYPLAVGSVAVQAVGGLQWVTSWKRLGSQRLAMAVSLSLFVGCLYMAGAIAIDHRG